MLACVNVAPCFFSETLEFQDREGRRILRRLAKNMNNLLGNRPMFPVRARLNLPVKAVRHIFDIQGSHGFLQNAPIMEKDRLSVKEA
jgi:hypothetical protein